MNEILEKIVSIIYWPLIALMIGFIIFFILDIISDYKLIPNLLDFYHYHFSERVTTEQIRFTYKRYKIAKKARYWILRHRLRNIKLAKGK